MCSGADCKCNIEGCSCNEKRQADSDKLNSCSFCDQKRTCIIITNDNELPLCDSCASISYLIN